jgi:hypothetical protein
LISLLSRSCQHLRRYRHADLFAVLRLITNSNLADAIKRMRSFISDGSVLPVIFTLSLLHNAMAGQLLNAVLIRLVG